MQDQIWFQSFLLREPGKFPIMQPEAQRMAKRSLKGVARGEHSRRRNKVSKCRKIGNADIVRKMQRTELVGKWGAKRKATGKKKRNVRINCIRAWKMLPHKSMCHPCATYVFYSHSKESHPVNHFRTNSSSYLVFRTGIKTPNLPPNYTQGLSLRIIGNKGSTWQTSRRDLILGLLWRVLFSKNISASGISHLFKILWSIVMKLLSSPWGSQAVT